eukprot:Phypoly_transcript_10730.p1 GENE.Phypoly_transcript_10730~~Phypoly_transcript_10730.p1  ORF type:complete len:361 (+),score=82.02 Phypoly_transcript_10730:128-1210(+)
MYKSTIALLLSLFAYLALGQNINAIVSYQDKIYAFDGVDYLDDGTGFVPHAYEITNGAQSNKFTLPLTNQGATPSSSFVNGNTLYQFSGAYGDATLSTYSLPLTNPVTATASVALPNQVQEIPAIISFEDGFAFVLCSRYLTVVDLATLTVTSSVLAVAGSKKTPGSLVYNAQTNKVYYFQTNYCFAGECQHIYVFDVSASGVLSTAAESDTFAPDYTTSFNSGELSGCALNSAAGAIWCLNAGTNQLVEISVSDFSNYTILATPAVTLSNGQVSFDFSSSRAYFTAAHADGTTFSIYEMNLEGNVIGALAVAASPVSSLSAGNGAQSLFVGNSAQVTLLNLDPAGNNDASVNANVINLA